MGFLYVLPKSIFSVKEGKIYFLHEKQYLSYQLNRPNPLLVTVPFKSVQNITSPQSKLHSTNTLIITVVSRATQDAVTPLLKKEEEDLIEAKLHNNNQD